MDGSAGHAEHPDGFINTRPRRAARFAALLVGRSCGKSASRASQRCAPSYSGGTTVVGAELQSSSDCCIPGRQSHVLCLLAYRSDDFAVNDFLLVVWPEYVQTLVVRIDVVSFDLLQRLNPCYGNPQGCRIVSKRILSCHLDYEVPS